MSVRLMIRAQIDVPVRFRAIDIFILIFLDVEVIWQMRSGNRFVQRVERNSADIKALRIYGTVRQAKIIFPACFENWE
jgi:hypothetical protein